jgi:hypothetical protein
MVFMLLKEGTIFCQEKEVSNLFLATLNWYIKFLLKMLLTLEMSLSLFN